MSKHPPLLRKVDVIAHYNTAAAVGRQFNPPLTRAAITQWPEYLPDYRAKDLLFRDPTLHDLVVDPETRLSMAELRERARP